MKKFAKLMLITLGFGLVASAVGFLTSKPAPAQLPPPVIPVRVTNTPLPVQGSVNANVTNTVPVAGTVNANVTNTVPVSGTVGVSNLPPVTLSGTPTFNFSNSSTTPLFVDTDGPARVGGAATCTVQLMGQASCTLTTVPNNQILVTEAISCEAQVSAGFDPPYMALVFNSPLLGGTGASSFLYNLAVPRVLTIGTEDRYLLTAPLTLYIAPGSLVLLGVGPNQTGSVLPEMSCTISGHLVNP